MHHLNTEGEMTSLEESTPQYVSHLEGTLGIRSQLCGNTLRVKKKN